MKKFGAILLATFLMLGILSGCGQGAPAASDTAAPDAETTEAAGGTTEPVSLRFSWWGSEVRHEATLAAIDFYQDQNPNVTIEAEYMGYDGYQDKLMTQIAGNNAPDIFTCVSEWSPAIAASNGFYDMTGKIDTSGHNPKINEACSYDGKLIGVNVSLNGRGYIYNKTLLDELGLEAPAGEYSMDALTGLWHDVYEQSGGETCGANDPRTYGYMMDVFGYVVMGKPEPYPYSNTELTMTAAEFTQFMEYFGALPEGSMLPPSEANFDEMISSPVATRRCAFCNINVGTFALIQSQTTDELAMIPFPVGPNGETANLARPGLILSVYSKSENPEEAIRFLDYFTNSPEAAKILKTSRGVLPTEVQRDALLEDESLLSREDKIVFDIINKIYAQENKQFLPGPVGAADVFEGLFRNIGSEVIFSESTPADAGEKFMEEAQKMLDNNN